MTGKKGDLEKVSRALRSRKEKAFLKKELSPLVDAIVNLYMSHDYSSTRAKLREISWTYFDFALGKYAENMQKRSPRKPYKFSTYFSWYIKTSIETYLGISKEPLKGIQSRRKKRLARL